MNPEQVVFLDCETTGLDPDRHEVWEVGTIRWAAGQWDEQRILLRDVDLSTADPFALKIGGFHERHPEGLGVLADPFSSDTMWLPGVDTARHVAEVTYGRHIVGAVPSFDANFLTRLLQRHRLSPGWHYHLVDVEALAAGWVANHEGPDAAAISLPWDSEQLSRAVGVEPGLFGRHTALGDARWAKAIYEAVMEP